MHAKVLILAVIYCAQSCIAQYQSPPELKNQFEKNWYVRSADKVVYSRTFNRQGGFGFTSCDASSRFCNVTLSATNSSDSSSRTCKFELDPYESTELGVPALFLADSRTAGKIVGVEWYRKGAYNHVDSFLSFLNMTECKSGANHFIGSIDEESPSRVIVYRHPRLIASASMRHERKIIRELSFGQPAQYGSSSNKSQPKYLHVNRSSVREEQPVELGSSEGFFFIADNATSNSKVDVMYANLTTLETRVLGSIGEIHDPTRTFPKTSGAHNKYGLCWKSLDRDSRVNCTQFQADGRRRSIGPVGLQLQEPIDWLAVHNLNDNTSMLLVTGRCEGNKCDRFEVRKVHADGRRGSTPFEVAGLNAECSDLPMNLSMDVVEDDSRREICFNFVCLNDRYGQGSSRKISTTVQYRRRCVDRDYVDGMN